ncbi:unnamed protein product [Hymenolepis diminuta]|uniref:MARVEL domain-containing protein n=1 Tax=Hymenolepis diminuta TaxID=6216 RepID=A0A564YRP6_HYMDI|nr:unnamed protein product [Hymenolepis diminuta]
MNKHIFFLVAILVTYLFTILSAALDMGPCGNIFSSSCSGNDMDAIRGLIGTNLFLFLVAAVFSVLYIMKRFKWALWGEIGFMVAISILLLAAIGLLYDGMTYLTSLFMTIAMTFAVAITGALLVGLLK